MPRWEELAPEQDALAKAVTATMAESAASIRSVIMAAAEAGVSANEIARRTRKSLTGMPGYSRPVILEILGAESVKETAIQGLAETGIKVGDRYDDEADVEVWEGAGRVVWITLSEAMREKSTVTRYQLGVGVLDCLRAVGLDLSQGESTLDMYQALAQGEDVEIYKPNSPANPPRPAYGEAP